MLAERWWLLAALLMVTFWLSAMLQGHDVEQAVYFVGIFVCLPHAGIGD